MKKILIISNYFPPEIGAASNRISNMASSFVKYNYNVDVICPLPNYPKGKVEKEYRWKLFHKNREDKITIHRFLIFPTNSRNFILRFFSMISFSISLWFSVFTLNSIKNIDKVIIQNSPIFVGFSSIILFGIIFKKKIILNVSDLWPKSGRDMGLIKNKFLYKILEKIENFNYRKANKILSQSEAIKSHIFRKSNKNSFVYKNINIQIFNPPNNKILGSNVRIVYAGLLGIAQGVLDLIKKINFEQSDIIFEIYGHGNQKQDIVDYIKKNNLKSVKYNGTFEGNQLAQTLLKYDFSIVPLISNIEGAFPSKIFELIQLSIPVIYIGEGEAQEFIEKNNLGFCARPKDWDKINKIIKTLEKIKQFEYDKIRANCKYVAFNNLNFKKQFEELIIYIN